jgi:hypothetical protein
MLIIIMLTGSVVRRFRVGPFLTCAHNLRPILLQLSCRDIFLFAFRFDIMPVRLRCDVTLYTRWIFTCPPSSPFFFFHLDAIDEVTTTSTSILSGLDRMGLNWTGLVLLID